MANYDTNENGQQYPKGEVVRNIFTFHTLNMRFANKCKEQKGEIRGL